MKKIISVLLAATMLLTVLCGCGEALTVTSKPVRATMMLTGEHPYELPILTNASWVVAANAEITQALAPFVDALTAANEKKPVGAMGYELQSDESGYTLCAYVDAMESAGRILLTRIFISSSGVVDASGCTVPEYLSDGDWLNGYLRLSSHGIDPNYDEAGEILTVRRAYEILVDYYEHYTGSEVDTSCVRLSSDEEYYIKSLALGICNSEYLYFEYDGEIEMYISTLNTMIVDMLEYMFTECLGRSSLYTSQDDLLDAIQLFMRLYFESPARSNPCSIDISSVELPEVMDTNVLTRNDMAMIYNAIYEQLFDELVPSDNSYLTDYPTDDFSTAYTMGFISIFPSFGLSSCYYDPREYQLFELVNCFVSGCHWRERAMETGDELIDSRSMVTMLGWVDEYLDGFTAPAGETVVVDNSREYQWYFTQYGTGEYSDVNCMPTITAMAIKWYYADSSVTPADLRELYLPDSTEGWYMAQVAGALDEYNVPYEWHDTSESIVEQLDQGHIVLTQMSEAPFDESGHCFVIYGYRKLGDSVQFMLHDPGIYDGIDCFGKYPGEAMLLDSGYVEWIISRITFSYITV